MAKVKHEIKSLQHPIVKHLIHVRQNRDYREEHQSVVIMGSNLIKEVCQKHPTKRLLVYDETFVPKGVSAEEIVRVSEAVMQKVSGVPSPEGILAEVAMPKFSALQGTKRLIACDGVSDPGNMGTLLRSALALGWEGAFILSTSCDPFNDKALRAAKGATFRLPLATGSWSDLETIIKKNKLQPLAADIEGDDAESIALKDNILLVLSNESQGLSKEAEKRCQKVTIPMSGKMESLNVSAAGAILMYLLKIE